LFFLVVVGQGDIVAAGAVERQISVNLAGGVDIFGVLLGGAGNIVAGGVHDIGVGGIIVHAPVAYGAADIAVFVDRVMHVCQVHAITIIDRQAIAQMIESELFIFCKNPYKIIRSRQSVKGEEVSGTRRFRILRVGFRCRPAGV